MIPRWLHAGNEALAFLLELAALAVLGWWGSSVGHSLSSHLLLGIGAPLVAVVLWALFAAPRATVQLPLAGVLAVKAAVFGGAALALWGIGHDGLAVAFAVIAFANTALATADRRALLNVSRS